MSKDLLKEAFSNYSEATFGDRSFPDASFIIEKGAEKDKKGRTLQKFRKLPHHNKNAKDPNENTTVNIPHLRNALARVSQIKTLKEDRNAFIKRARAHLQKHAKALLKTFKKSSAEYNELQDIIKEIECQ